MFIDSAIIFCEAGQGGNGCNSYEQARNLNHKRPNGGDGGAGGSIVFVANSQVHTLLDLQMRKTFRADQGKHGGSSDMNGAVAEDFVIKIPIGTEVYDEKTGYLLRDLAREGESIVVCKGGAGGKGNHKKAEATPGEPGEVKTIRL